MSAAGMQDEGEMLPKQRINIDRFHDAGRPPIHHYFRCRSIQFQFNFIVKLA